MRELKEKEVARRKSMEAYKESFGISQAFELGKRTKEEYVLAIALGLFQSLTS